MKRRFAIPSLLAAGLIPLQSVALAAARPDEDGSDSLFDLFHENRTLVISGHRSHSSHSSHGSHRSSSGSGYSTPRLYTPPPVYDPPAALPPSRNKDAVPPASILPGPPAVAPKASPDASAAMIAEKLKDIVKLVQLALKVYGYYTGELDGVVGPDTSTAISKMQSDYGLKVTGTVTPEVLNALKLNAQ